MSRSPVLLALSFALVSCQPSSPASVTPPTRCESGGAFSAPNDQGALVDVPQSGPVVLELWARWCEGCETAVPALLAQRDDLDGAQVILLGVVEEGETIDDARATLASWGVNEPFMIDRGGAMMRKYGFAALPASVVLDAQGNIRWTSSKDSSVDDIVAAAHAAAQPCSN